MQINYPEPKCGFDYQLIAMGLYSDGSVTLKQLQSSLDALIKHYPAFRVDKFWNEIERIMAMEIS